MVYQERVDATPWQETNITPGAEGLLGLAVDSQITELKSFIKRHNAQLRGFKKDEKILTGAQKSEMVSLKKE